MCIRDRCIQIPPAILNELFGVNMGDLYFRSSSTYNGMYYDYGYMYDLSLIHIWEFSPDMSSARREELIEGWHKAVDRTMGWARRNRSE